MTGIIPNRLKSSASQCMPQGGYLFVAISNKAFFACRRYAHLVYRCRFLMSKRYYCLKHILCQHHQNRFLTPANRCKTGKRHHFFCPFVWKLFTRSFYIQMNCLKIIYNYIRVIKTWYFCDIFVIFFVAKILINNTLDTFKNLIKSVIFFSVLKTQLVTKKWPFIIRNLSSIIKNHFKNAHKIDTRFFQIATYEKFTFA
jgi:hypothetical protein